MEGNEKETQKENDDDNDSPTENSSDESFEHIDMDYKPESYSENDHVNQLQEAGQKVNVNIKCLEKLNIM